MLMNHFIVVLSLDENSSLVLRNQFLVLCCHALSVFFYGWRQFSMVDNVVGWEWSFLLHPDYWEGLKLKERRKSSLGKYVTHLKAL